MVDLKSKPEIEIHSAEDVPRRRHRSDADKIRIVEERFQWHCQGTVVARRHGISRSLPAICGVCQRCCPLISCGGSDFRAADFVFGVEPDGPGQLPVAGFIPSHHPIPPT